MKLFNDALQLIKKIAQLEKENLTKKPWQMSGEAGSTARPMNSLLEEDLNFDHTTAVGELCYQILFFDMSFGHLSQTIYFNLC